MTDELIDIIDDDDIVIGQEMRGKIHQRGLLHRGVHVFLITPERKLVVQKRSKDRHTFPQALDCSLSEHVKSGETYMQAAIRGLVEEMSIHDVQITALVKFKMVYGPGDVEMCTLYEGRVDPALIKFDPQEVEGISLYTLEELQENMKCCRENFTGWFLQIINWYLNKPSMMTVIQTYSHSRLFL